MITKELFDEQLLKLYNNGVIQHNRLCQLVFYDSKNHSIITKTEIPTNVDRSEKLDHLELKITYSQVYQEPMLLLRVWEQENESEVATYRIRWSQDIRSLLGIGDQFNLGLDCIAATFEQQNEVWYIFHPCDTAQIVGDKDQYIEKYLERWEERRVKKVNRANWVLTTNTFSRQGTTIMSSSQSFVTVRGQAISLETQAESLLSRYSTFAQTTSSEPTGQEKKLDKQLETALLQRQDIIESLTKICDENPNISASKLSQLQRHKEILQEHWKSFRNIRSSIQQERNRLNLLFSVKNDIAQQQQSMTDNETVGNEDDYYHNESRRVDQSHNIIDRLITQAWETRDEFTSQSNILQSANNRILTTLQRIPGINQVIMKIGTRRRKNAIILATVIVICILILFFTW